MCIYDGMALVAICSLVVLIYLQHKNYSKKTKERELMHKRISDDYVFMLLKKRISEYEEKTQYSMYEDSMYENTIYRDNLRGLYIDTKCLFETLCFRLPKFYSIHKNNPTPRNKNLSGKEYDKEEVRVHISHINKILKLYEEHKKDQREKSANPKGVEDFTIHAIVSSESE